MRPKWKNGGGALSADWIAGTVFAASRPSAPTLSISPVRASNSRSNWMVGNTRGRTMLMNFVLPHWLGILARNSL